MKMKKIVVLIRGELLWQIIISLRKKRKENLSCAVPIVDFLAIWLQQIETDQNTWYNEYDFQKRKNQERERERKRWLKMK